MLKFVSASGLLTVLALSGCGSLPCGDPHPYYNNTAGAPLKTPAGLSVPAPDPSFAIPGEIPASGKRTDRDASGVCLVTPPEVITPASSVTPKAVAPSPAPAKPAPGSTRPVTAPNAVPAASTIAPPAVASGGPIG